MCLIKDRRLPRFAWKPIIVYKVVDKLFENNEFYTPFRFHKVEMNKTLKHSWKFPVIRSLFVNVIRGEGVHAYLIKKDLRAITVGQAIIKCEIPRFTFYWTDTKIYKEIASTRLKPLEVCEDKTILTCV